MGLPSRDDVLKLDYLHHGAPAANVKAKNSADDDLLNLGEPNYYLETVSTGTPTAGNIYIRDGGNWYEQTGTSVTWVNVPGRRGSLATYNASVYIKINGSWIGPWD
jgi:hypothetical protein